MDTLIHNLQTHQLNRANDTTKKDKSLVLKVAQCQEFDEDEDEMAYLTRRFQKFVRKHGGFKKKRYPSRATASNDPSHKCGKLGHFIRDCPMHKIDHKDNAMHRGTKDNSRDPILNNKSRKAAIDYGIKEALAI